MDYAKYPITFNLSKLVNEELPWTQAFFREEPLPGLTEGKLNREVLDYFEFISTNQKDLPVYQIPAGACAGIETDFENAYKMLVEALGKLFNEPQATIVEYMGCDFLRKHPYFIDYAKHTFRTLGSARQAIYGRFDAAYNPETDLVTGIYEFNGDTPTMLFESVHVQNLVCEQITGYHEKQLNSFWPLLENLFDQMGDIPGTAAVVFDGSTFEDIATCETIAQIMGAGNNCLYVDSQMVDYDLLNKATPWTVNDTPLSVIFALIPWEELVEACPHAYQNWMDWADNVTFLEPAWRWFLSNKGIWAYVSHLFETDREFNYKYRDVPTLKTDLTPDFFKQANYAYVKKPKIGRMSSNIEIFDDRGIQTFVTDGAYADDDCVYQLHHKPYILEGRNNFIIGMFMVPDMTTDYNSQKEATAATLCIREFDSPVLGIKNERFIPHILVD